jgi:phospholipase C
MAEGDMLMPPPGTIQHLVVLMLENRSFDHMLGFMKSATYAIDGLNGTETNQDSTGAAVTVSQDADYSGDLTPDPGHAFDDVNIQLFGNSAGTGDATMQGFVSSYAQMAGSSAAQSRNIMKCFSPGPVPECKIPILMTLAEQYAVCDRWFASVPGPTLPNRCFAHAATSIGRVDMSPIWYDVSKTIYELLAENKVTSKIFYHDATMAETFKNFLKDQSYFGSFDDFLDACGNGKLPSYSFIEPRYNADNTNNLAANDQHPDHDIAEGETLIQDVYNAIRKSKVWENTILLIVYDEHGGLFDHVPPPATVNPDGQNCANPPFNFQRLGLRVPAVVVSPWIPAGTIDHTQYDHASISATARKLFYPAAAPLTNRDAIARTFDSNLTLAAARQDQISFSAPQKDAALARVANTAQTNARTAQHAALPLSDLQKTLVQQTNFMNQHGLGGQASNTTPEQIQTEQQAADFHAAVMSSVVPPKTGKATP